MAAAPEAGRQPRIGIALWGTEPAAAIANNALVAEQAGLESAWLIDSQLLCRELFVMLTLCLARTSRLRLATGVTQPVTRHVSVAASAMATLAEFAPGRVMMGIGSGFSSLRSIGMRAARVDEVANFAETTRALIAGQDATLDNEFAAALSWADEAKAVVPIHLAASGPRMTRSAGRHGDGAIVLQGIAPEMIDRAIGWVDDGAAGRPQGGIPEISCWAPFSVDDDSARAYDRARSRVASALMQANPDEFDGEERHAIQTLKQNYAVGEHAHSVAHHAAIVPNSLVRKYAVAGDVGEVREQLRRLGRHPRLHRVILTPQVSGDGAIPMPQLLRRLGDDILPYL